jgi:hypothetical protein
MTFEGEHGRQDVCRLGGGAVLHPIGLSVVVMLLGAGAPTAVANGGNSLIGGGGMDASRRGLVGSGDRPEAVVAVWLGITVAGTNDWSRGSAGGGWGKRAPDKWAQERQSGG